ncbi:MAG: secretin and TonB N-terminal domain-containing protein, partial [Elusimicrobia bacterium]|nr:secretin and TonB N-terminal domain-containing protein [Elusimicrobiota bacterium]
MTTTRAAAEAARPARRRRRKVLLLWAGLWLLESLAGPLAPAWAQRRRGEPEANSEFQDQVQGQAPQAGAPFDPNAAPRGDAGAAEPTAEPGAAPPPASGVQGVQIGGAPTPPAPPPSSPLETRVTVRVKDAPLATFLDTISAQAKVNFIITEGLTSKRVTAFLQNVTVREALQILLEIKGLTYQQIGRSNTYVVSPRSATAPNNITRIYTLSHVPLIPILNEGAGAGGGAA